jgi:hypothetical protein
MDSSMSDDADLTPLEVFRADPTEHGRDAGSAPAMLRLKLLKPGGKPTPRERWAFPYTLLKRVELENASKLILSYTEATITITGPRMSELFDQVSQHKAAILEVSKQANRLEDERPISLVDGIEVELRTTK